MKNVWFNFTATRVSAQGRPAFVVYAERRLPDGALVDSRTMITDEAKAQDLFDDLWRGGLRPTAIKPEAAGL